MHSRYARRTCERLPLPRNAQVFALRGNRRLYPRAAEQELLKSWAPQLKAPRFVNSPTLLGGAIYCADCGGATILRTFGKGEEYRY